ncbi:MAG: SpoIIIAH-like family protein [Defluviitaleaceae bacterium]|nr:SpoIIIAH-like family protein [Defluviitaleaceae bacterium]
MSINERGKNKMFVVKRNQVIITALVLMIAVAGYLSYMDMRRVDDDAAGFVLDEQGGIDALIPNRDDLHNVQEEASETGLIGVPWASTHDPAIHTYGEIDFPSITELDLEDFITVPTNEENLTEAGEAIFVDNRIDASFFVQARLQREQSRSNERVILNDIINNANVAEDQRAQAADTMLDIQWRIERETAAEALIESKGFSEVYVRISDNSVDVIVNKPELTPQDLAQIMDVIKRKTGMTETQIHISPMRTR